MVDAVACFILIVWAKHAVYAYEKLHKEPKFRVKRLT